MSVLRGTGMATAPPADRSSPTNALGGACLVGSSPKFLRVALAKFRVNTFESGGLIVESVAEQAIEAGVTDWFGGRDTFQACWTYVTCRKP